MSPLCPTHAFVSGLLRLVFLIFSSAFVTNHSYCLELPCVITQSRVGLYPLGRWWCNLLVAAYAERCFFWWWARKTNYNPLASAMLIHQWLIHQWLLHASEIITSVITYQYIITLLLLIVVSHPLLSSMDFQPGYWRFLQSIIIIIIVTMVMINHCDYRYCTSMISQCIGTMMPFFR